MRSFLLVLLQSALLSPVVGGEEQLQFSAAPNNTPISKVYIFGKPIYIREPFVLPQRDLPVIEDSKRSLRASEYAEKAGGGGEKYAEKAGGGENYVEGGGAQYVENVTEPAGPKYPLKQCYTEMSGFMCCNLKLEKVIAEAVKTVKNDKICNLQTVSNLLQKTCESSFGTEFETITGTSDFASKIHFYSDLVCKMEREGRVILVYATPNRHNYAMPYHL